VSTHPRVSIDQACSIRLSFSEDIALWHQLDIDLVGLTSPKLELVEWDTTILTDARIRVSSVGTEPRLLLRSLKFAAAVGAKTVWTCTGPLGPRSWEQAADDFCHQIAPAVALSQDLGINLALEPTNSMRSDVSFIHTMRDTCFLARSAGIGVVLDFYTCWYERGIETLLRDNIDLLMLVQVCDYQIGTFNTPNRSVIGDGDLPVEGLIAMSLDAGYDGIFDLEILGPKIEAEGYKSAIQRSLDRLGEMLSRQGT
jgi:sugar phosphate isomerase/epimerase